LPNALKAELQKILLRRAIMEGMMHLGQLFHLANTTRLAIPLRPREWLEDRRTRMENGLKTLARSAQRDNLWWNHQHATSEGLDVYASELCNP